MKISIIVPVYNVEKYLMECLDSILKQSFADFEAILVNDGSTDGSGAICREYAEKDSRVKYFEKSNGGLVSAVKFGVLHSAGDYIAFVDSDDFIGGDYLKNLYRPFESDPELDIVSASALRYTDGIATLMRLNHAEGKILIDDEFKKRLTSDYGSRFLAVSNNRWSKMFKREIVLGTLETYNENVSFGEDQLMMIAALLSAKKVFVAKSADYYYRYNPSSIVSAFKSDIDDRFFKLFEGVKNIDAFRECENYATQYNTMVLLNINDAYLHYAMHGKSCGKLAKKLTANTEIKNALKDYYAQNLSKFDRIMIGAQKTASPVIISAVSKFCAAYIKHKNKMQSAKSGERS